MLWFFVTELLKEYTVLTHIGVEELRVKTKINIPYPWCKFNMRLPKVEAIGLLVPGQKKTLSNNLYPVKLKTDQTKQST